jgi:histidinol-phosphate aminotransferase
LAVRLFVEAGVTVANSYGAYPTYNFHVAGFGGRLVTTPYVNDHEDPASLLALAKKEKARLIYFANPDNPMGTCWKANVVQELIDNIPEGTLLMLDEAYHEFAEGTVPALDMTNPNVLRFRTFSKAYGMAGARVGYALGHPHLISAFDKIRNHFGVNRMGQAGPAALADQDHLVSGRCRPLAKTGALPSSWLRASPHQPLVAVIAHGTYARKFGTCSRYIRAYARRPPNRCIRSAWN